jgi:hypothetical protein
MSKFFLAVVVLGLLLMPLAAQDYPKGEVFGGYQYTRLNIEGVGLNMNGWNASVTGNLNKWFGVTGDFSGAYKSVSGASLHIYSYTFGPTISAKHDGPVNPFVHFLFGGASATGSAVGLGSASVNGFTMMAGGGVDAKLAPRFAVRLFQGDWIYYRFQGVSESKNVRISTGIVLRF